MSRQSIRFWILAILELFFSLSICIAQQNPKESLKIDFSLSENDIQETISSLKTEDPEKTAQLFRQKMPPSATDTKFRAEIIGKLSPLVKKLRINDEALNKNLKLIIDPVLSFYNRDKSYEIIIINHETPFLMSDSGVVLVISTGLINEYQNEDELLGYIAHEVGHEYFQQYSIYTKYLFNLVKENGKEKSLIKHLAILLSIIELECDAFAAITLANLGYRPTAFIDCLERVAKKYPDYPKGFHPAESFRKKLVFGISSEFTLAKEKRISSPLLEEIQKRCLLMAKK